MAAHPAAADSFALSEGSAGGAGAETARLGAGHLGDQAVDQTLPPRGGLRGARASPFVILKD